MNAPQETPEQEARRLRELLYGPLTDDKWAQVERHWVEDLEWLRMKCATRGEP